MSTLNQVGATVSHSEQDVSNLNAKPSWSSIEEHQEYLYQRYTKFVVTLYEPRHYKTNKVTVRPAKTQISLGIRPV